MYHQQSRGNPNRSRFASIRLSAMVEEYDVSRKKYCLCVGFTDGDDESPNCGSRWYLVNLEGEGEGEVEVDMRQSFKGPADCPHDFSIASLGSTLYLVGGRYKKSSSDDDAAETFPLGTPGVASRSVFSYDVDGEEGWVRQGDLNIPRRFPTVVACPAWPGDKEQDRRLYCFGTAFLPNFLDSHNYAEVFQPGPGTWSFTSPPPLLQYWGCGNVVNAGFYTIQGKRFVFVNDHRLSSSMSCFDIETNRWDPLVYKEGPMIFKFGRTEEQPILVDNIWCACDGDDGLLYAQCLRTDSVFEGDVQNLDVSDGDFYSLQTYVHSLVQIDTNTLCRLSFPKIISKTKQVRCLRFQLVEQDGSLCASNITTNTITVQGDKFIGCVVLKYRSRK